MTLCGLPAMLEAHCTDLRSCPLPCSGPAWKEFSSPAAASETAKRICSVISRSHKTLVEQKSILTSPYK